ncbi:MAG: ECF transporter S component [Anaerolineae bacterium]|nr:ECF transporter S component [Anaerolineae bacterium]
MKGRDVRRIALVVVMAAVVFVLTRWGSVPNPVGGYMHLGDVGATFAALSFGPWLGFLIAGGGMALADLTSPYASFAAGTLVIHGVQAVVIALIGRRRKTWLMLVGAVAGGLVVVGGYVLYEWLILRWTLARALGEIPFNAVQVSLGLLGVPLYLLVIRAYPPLLRWIEP